MTEDSGSRTLGRADKISLLVIAVTCVITAALYDQLPEQMPMHWNAAGEVDGWGSRAVGAWLMPGMAAATWLLFWFLPALSPKGFTLEKSARAVALIQVAIIVSLCAIGLLLTFNGVGYDIPIAQSILVGLGLMIIFTGNVMGKVRKNFYIGIRTPWTLADDEVWARTHRLAAKLMLIAGVITVLSVLTPWSAPISITVITISFMIPIVYSFLIYRKLNDENG